MDINHSFAHIDLHIFDRLVFTVFHHVSPIFHRVFPHLFTTEGHSSVRLRRGHEVFKAITDSDAEAVDVIASPCAKAMIDDHHLPGNDTLGR